MSGCRVGCADGVRFADRLGCAEGVDSANGACCAEGFKYVGGFASRKGRGSAGRAFLGLLLSLGVLGVSGGFAQGAPTDGVRPVRLVCALPECMGYVLDGLQCDHARVTSETLQIVPDDTGQPCIHPSPPGRYYLVRWCGSEVVDTISVESLPLTAQVQYGALTGGRVGVGEFRAHRRVLARIAGFDISGYCTMGSYTIRHVRAGELVETYRGEGSRDIDPEFLARARSGDTFIFERLAYTCPCPAGEQRGESFWIDIR